MDMTQNPSNVRIQGGYRQPCKVKLIDENLWRKFHTVGTEMIVTKCGRRMFPTVKIQISDLDPAAYYCIFLEMVPVSNYRYKYSNATGWLSTTNNDLHGSNLMYRHPESPSKGDHWMSEIISFSRVKLTNCIMPPLGQVMLTSMHKYQPQLVIIKSEEPNMEDWASSMRVSFPIAQFIAVTAYQNEEITKLKIDNNPFATGFRKNGRGQTKRKLSNDSEAKDDTRSEHSDESSSDIEVCDDDKFVDSTISIRDAHHVSRVPTEATPYPTPYYYNYNYNYYSYINSIMSPTHGILPPSVYNNYGYGIPPFYTPWNTPIGYAEDLSVYQNQEIIDVVNDNNTQSSKYFTDFSIRTILGMQ